MTSPLLVTGATGAVGRALVARLRQLQRPVLAAARNAEALQALAQETGAVPLPCGDLSDPAAAAALVNDLALHGPLAGWAHAVGSSLIRPLHLTSDADAQLCFNVNYWSAHHLLKALLPQQLPHKAGMAIVWFGSVVANRGFPNHEVIAAAKAALGALAVSTAATYVDKGIRANVLLPSLTRSALSSRLLASPEAERRMAAMNPMQHIGEPDELAALAAFLLSDDARWITGQQIGIDGGHGIIHPLPKTL
jgi:NAD(P)-dependent dehydrogenase (short-subunit alcohol dehydrogenase family)